MIIKVKVKPGSSKQEIVKSDEGYLVFLKQKAEKGKANAELVNLLARHFKVSAGDIEIKGKTSREKLVEMRD